MFFASVGHTTDAVIKTSVQSMCIPVVCLSILSLRFLGQNENYATNRGALLGIGHAMLLLLVYLSSFMPITHLFSVVLIV